MISVANEKLSLLKASILQNERNKSIIESKWNEFLDQISSFPFLPNENTRQLTDVMKLTREAYETLILYTTKSDHFIDLFEQNILILLAYYECDSNTESYNFIQAFYLIYLLSKECISDFYKHLVRIPIDRQESAEIRFALLLEQLYREGCYATFHSALEENAESQRFLALKRELKRMVNTQIGKNCSAAYPGSRIARNTFKDFVHITDENELNQFCSENGWQCEGDQIHFVRPTSKVSTRSITHTLAHTTQTYAAEIDTIV